MGMTNHDQTDTPAVHIPPPVIVGVLLALGLVLDHVLHTSFGEQTRLLPYIGYGICAFGLALVLWCAYLYRQAKTSILPHTKDSNMIKTGPFGWSRNPIYLSMLMVFIGIILIMDAPLALFFLLPTWFVLRYYVIAREEAYLRRRFGDAYISYQANVRRWF